MYYCAFDVRNNERDQCCDSRCNVVKEESDKPLKCVIAKTLPLPRSRAKRRHLRQSKHEESKNKAQKESTTVGLEPTTLASHVIGGLRATICWKLEYALEKNTN
jgi:hypothetical protein